MDLQSILNAISLPAPITEFLEQTFLGNSVLQYGLYACVLLVAWVLPFVASYALDGASIDSSNASMKRPVNEWFPPFDAPSGCSLSAPWLGSARES